jgi:hypothetical protein
MKKMQRQLSLLALVCALTITAGCSSKQKQISTPEDHAAQDHPASATTADASHVAHPPGQPADKVESNTAKPTLKMSVDTASSKATVHFKTTNFKISPEHYSGAHVPGEGHIHLFVDGSPTRIGVKGETYDLTSLTKGHHKLTASLHTNNHQPYNVEDAVEFDIK